MIKLAKHRWKNAYQRTLEFCLLLSLLMMISLFFSFRKYETAFELPNINSDEWVIESLPPITRFPEKIPRPPVVPVPVDPDMVDDIPDAVSFEPQQISVGDIPPPPEEEEIVEVWQLRVKPKLLNKVLPEYPEMARRSGHQGRVVLKLLVGKDGAVEHIDILKDDRLLREAAMAAAWKYRFSPARQGIRSVKVWMRVPFVFRLN